MEKITIYRYIASTRPIDSHDLLNRYGRYRRARNEKELESQLKHFVRQNGSKALMELSKIHPDRELIEQDLEENKSSFVQPTTYSNADGETSNNNNISKSDKEDISYSKMLIWGSFVLLGIAIIMKKQ